MLLHATGIHVYSFQQAIDDGVTASTRNNCIYLRHSIRIKLPQFLPDCWLTDHIIRPTDWLIDLLIGWKTTQRFQVLIQCGVVTPYDMATSIWVGVGSGYYSV